MTGNDIYIGRNTNQNLNKQKVTPPATNGSIVIDACNNGVITQTGKQNTILADNCVIGSVV